MDGKKQGLRIFSLTMALLTALVFGKASNAGAWATITVNSLADPGAPGICALRDAIIAANTMSPTNGCAAGNGNDTIVFSVTGIILLASSLPEITDSQLTIKGPIEIDGGNADVAIAVAASATLNVKDVTIANGNPLASRSFGCISNQGTLAIRDSTFSHNSGDINLHGPGCISNDGTATITNSTFSGNSDGGAIRNTGKLTVTNSLISDNAGAGDAGLINGGTASITDSTFSSNHGGFNGVDGAGGIDNGGAMMIANSTFARNSALRRGGAITNSGELTITNCTFSGNGADFGGAISTGSSVIAIGGGELTITNSTFSGNSADSGGGAIAGSAIISNSTFAANNSPAGGLGGGDILGSAEFHGTILAGPSGTSNCVGTITDLGFNISDDDSCGFTAVGSQNNTDPQLDPTGLSNNGGPTETIALLSGSPAIDVIPLDACTDQDGNRLTTDQRGFPRPDAGESICDSGAYEFQDFAGDPGSTNCYGRSLSALSRHYRNLNTAASAMGFRNVKALQTAIRAFCKS